MFLIATGYQYFILYTNVGDLLMGIDVENDKEILCQLTDYYSGRNILLFMDIAAYPRHQQEAYTYALKQEQEHFAKARHYSSSCTKDTARYLMGYRPLKRNQRLSMMPFSHLFSRSLVSLPAYLKACHTWTLFLFAIPDFDKELAVTSSNVCH